MAPHVATNPYAELARQKKATKLADYICGQTEITDEVVSDLEHAGRDWWVLAAKRAHVNEPSGKTINLTLSIIRQRNATASGASTPRERRPAPNPPGVNGLTAEGSPAVRTHDPLDPDDDDLDEILASHGVRR
jgi:hypothetical protein